MKGEAIPQRPLTKKQRKNRKSGRRWLAHLAETWPQTFDLQNPRPLATGIMSVLSAEIHAAGGKGHSSIRYALKRYASHLRYIKALAAGGPRYNLKGEPEGEVTPEQQQQATETLKIMQEQNVLFTGDIKP